jgi:hypothetical protein
MTRKTVVWGAVLVAAAASLGTPAAAAGRHLDHDRSCSISGRPNERPCLLQFQRVPRPQDPGPSGPVMVQTLHASQNGRPIGFVTGLA